MSGRHVSRREALRITAVAGLGIAFGGVLTREILRMADLTEFRVTRRQLGTSVTISVHHTDANAAHEMVGRAFETMERLESILSRHRPGTALDRLNTHGVIEGPPADLVNVVRRAIEVARLTDGAFDPTVRPLLALYERWAHDSSVAGPEPATRPDAAGAVAEALALVDYRELAVGDDEVRLGRPGMAVTLDGIAKGYVVDRTTASLASDGADRVLVEAGGDLAAHRDLTPDASRPPSMDAWHLGIQDPRAGDRILGVVALEAEGMASSGDYMQSFTVDRSLHHILDPRSGRSPGALAASTVIAPSAMDADALSTAAMVMGPEAAMTLIDDLDGIEGMLVTKDGARLESRGFARYLIRESA